MIEDEKILIMLFTLTNEVEKSKLIFCGEERLPDDVRLPAAFKDERININLLKPFMSEIGYKNVHQMFVEIGKNAIKCGICEKKGNKNQIFITCDRCLQPIHLSCLELRRKPRGFWFCAKCVENVEKGEIHHCYQNFSLKGNKLIKKILKSISF